MPLPPTRRSRPRPAVQFNDDQLQWSRLDFIKLCDLEQVQAFVQTGYAYAERTDAAGARAAARGCRRLGRARATCTVAVKYMGFCHGT